MTKEKRKKERQEENRGRVEDKGNRTKGKKISKAEKWKLKRRRRKE